MEALRYEAKRSEAKRVCELERKWGGIQKNGIFCTYGRRDVFCCTGWKRGNRTAFEVQVDIYDTRGLEESTRMGVRAGVAVERKEKVGGADEGLKWAGDSSTGKDGFSLKSEG